MRAAVAGIILESNSFSPQRSDERYFRGNGFLLRGKDVIDYHTQVENEIAGFLDICSDQGTDVFCSYAGWAVPYGPMPSNTYVKIKTQILEDFSKELSSIDGIYLALHGSMVVEGEPDPEGDLIEAVKKLAGTRLVVVTLDFHGNVTEKMARSADIIVGYNSFPHDNMYETGEKAGVLFHQYAHHSKQLITAFIKIPMITPLEKMTIADNPPMKQLISKASLMEKDQGICSVSVFGVQPWIDVPELGSSIVVSAEKSRKKKAETYCTELAGIFWEAREYLHSVELFDVQTAIQAALGSDKFPVLLNEPSDNVGSGATGDSTSLLRALLDSDIEEPTILTICDPEAVKKCHALGTGKHAAVLVGGLFNPDEPSVKISGIIRTLSDGKYVFQGPVQHGVSTSMGLTAVIEFRKRMYLQITETPPYTIDPEHYRCVGLFPERMKLVGIKSQGSYKASYETMQHSVIFVDTPGISRSNILQVPYTQVDTDKIFPFNNEAQFVNKPLLFCNS